MSEPDVKIPGSRFKFLLVVIVSIIAVAIAIAVLLHPSESDRERGFRMISGSLGILFFGAAGVFAAYKAIDPGPALILTADKLINRSSVLQIPEVSWSEISHAEIVPFLNQRVLIVHLRDPEAVLNRQSPAVQQVQFGNIHLLGSPIVIAGSILSVSLETVLEMINERIRN